MTCIHTSSLRTSISYMFHSFSLFVDAMFGVPSNVIVGTEKNATIRGKNSFFVFFLLPLARLS